MKLDKKSNEEKSKLKVDSSKPVSSKKPAKHVRVVLRSDDAKILDQTARDFVSNLKRLGVVGAIRGPVPLPKKRKVWTLLTSPHIDKKARTQIQRFSRKRVIDLPLSKNIVDILDSSCSIPSLVEIEIKT